MSLGVQAGASSSSGSRKGALDNTGLGSQTKGWRDLAGPWQDLYDSAKTSLAPGSAADRSGFFSQLMSGSPSDSVVHQGAFERLINGSGTSPLPGGGAANMQTMASRNPYDGAYEQQTQDAFVQRTADSLNQVGTSPTMMDGGVAARGYAQSDALQQLGLQRGEELRREQMATAQQAQGAAGLLDQSRQQIDQQSLGANTALNELLRGYQQSQLAAAGQSGQDAASYAQFVNNMLSMFTPQLNESREHHETKENEQHVSGGASCCWILLESYHGTMPTWVRECRDEFAPESSERRLGYRRMASVLVPLMRRYGVVRAAVWHLMVKPISRWGGWHKRVPLFKHRKRDAFAVRFWFKVWEVLGWL